jgi:hypothetical protein
MTQKQGSFYISASPQPESKQPPNKILVAEQRPGSVDAAGMRSISVVTMYIPTPRARRWLLA